MRPVVVELGVIEVDRSRLDLVWVNGHFDHAYILRLVGDERLTGH